MKKRFFKYDFGTLLLAGGMLLLVTACSKDETEDGQRTDISDKDIRMNVDVWRVMEGTRATTFDNPTALQNEGSFTCYAYNGETTTTFINGSTVNWIGSENTWAFADGKKYWPATGSLDFFAYMPAEKPAYISAVSYTTARTPTITCTSLPMTSDGQASIKEFVYGLVIDQTKDVQGSTGVTMNFLHPFARIYLRWSDVDHSAITLNSVKLKNIYNNGTCTLSYDGTNSKWISTWSPNGDKTDFSSTTLAANDLSDAVPYLVIPQTFAGTIEVNASWNDWGDTPVPHTVTTTIPPINWEAGKSYTYTFNISTDDLVVNVSNFTEQW